MPEMLTSVNKAEKFEGSIRLEEWEYKDHPTFFEALDSSRDILGRLGVTETVPNRLQVKSSFEKYKIKQSEGGPIGFAIIGSTREEQSKLLGNISFTKLDLHENAQPELIGIREGAVEINYWRVRQFSGYMTAAVDEAIKEHIQKRPNTQIVAQILVDNQPSIELLQNRLGFSPDLDEVGGPQIYDDLKIEKGSGAAAKRRVYFFRIYDPEIG